jgi:H+/gluconate symporter-like permease
VDGSRHPARPGDLVESFEGGAGDTLRNVGIVLALGTMLRKLLAESGGADQVARTVIGRARDDPLGDRLAERARRA